MLPSHLACTALCTTAAFAAISSSALELQRSAGKQGAHSQQAHNTRVAATGRHNIQSLPNTFTIRQQAALQARVAEGSIPQRQHQNFTMASTHQQLLHLRQHALAAACIALAAARRLHRRNTPQQLPAAGGSSNRFTGRHPCSRCRPHLPHTAALRLAAHYQGCRSLPLQRRRGQPLPLGCALHMPLPASPLFSRLRRTRAAPAGLNQGKQRRMLHPGFAHRHKHTDKLVHMAHRHMRSAPAPPCCMQLLFSILCSLQRLNAQRCTVSTAITHLTASAPPCARLLQLSSCRLQAATAAIGPAPMAASCRGPQQSAPASLHCRTRPGSSGNGCRLLLGGLVQCCLPPSSCLLATGQGRQLLLHLLHLMRQALVSGGT